MIGQDQHRPDRSKSTSPNDETMIASIEDAFVGCHKTQVEAAGVIAPPSQGQTQSLPASLLAALARASEVSKIDKEELIQAAVFGRPPPASTQNRKDRRAATQQFRQETKSIARPPNRATKAERHDAKRMERQLEWIRTNADYVRCCTEYTALAHVPYDLWCLVRAIVTDDTGACAEHWLRKCPSIMYSALVRRCALIPTVLGRNHYTWRDQRARHLVAVAALFFGLQLLGPRHGGIHGRAWTSVTRGLCRNLILTVLEPDPRYRPSLGYLTGIYGWGGRWNSTPFARGSHAGPGCGILTALIQIGAIWRDPDQSQHYATASGWQPNAYWITSPEPEYGARPDDIPLRYDLYREEANLGNSKPAAPG